MQYCSHLSLKLNLLNKTSHKHFYKQYLDIVHKKLGLNEVMQVTMIISEFRYLANVI